MNWNKNFVEKETRRTKNILTLEESMTNFFGDEILVIKPHTINKGTNDAFDNNLSLKMDKARFEKFKKKYGLKFLHKNKHFFGYNWLLFVTPTNHVIQVSEFKNPKDYDYEIVNIMNTKIPIKNLKDVLDTIKTPTEINPECILKEMFCDFHCFPSGGLNYEQILMELFYVNDTEIEIDFLLNYVKDKIQEYKSLSNNITKPESGTYYRRINIKDSGDYSYSDKPIYIQRVTETNVYFSNPNLDIEHVCELHNFEKNFEEASKSYEKTEALIDSALCYFLNDDLISNICNGEKTKQIEMRELEISDSPSGAVYILNDTAQLSVYSRFLTQVVSLSYVRDNKNSEKNITFGTNLDLPYILNEVEDNSLTEEQIAKLSRQFGLAVSTINEILICAKKSGMVSEEYCENTMNKVQTNIGSLRNNWEKILSKLANYERNKDDYEYDS